ncbi:MAG: hypothetical protein A3A97_04250 [Candidatus Terrybacteria bacterium RIFCSPLOWO2_01_FULL_40_23]|uniref:General secretion pathway GspH domain-containing protein n=1 Tax=Candidatus Terrybacteria bacterium RIFCSPLOWO2_01_FULL_40_23 TaxID=1802366 RepID=A0A1G2PZ53_9BACT|nr:MAG: hypothetical protein A3A97_04250 [Candidatus Terrybacteria bacterium RIFCSPLOWO2_01_FULL_40_23]
MKLPSILYSHTPNNNQKNRPSKSLMSGFSIVEVMLVISIILVLSVTLITRFNGANSSNTLKDNQAKVINILEEARNRSASGADGTDHGIYIDTVAKKIILFTGPCISPCVGKTIDLSASISSLSVAPVTDQIVFKRITAATEPATTITISNTSGANLQVTVNQNGTITPN